MPVALIALVATAALSLTAAAPAAAASPSAPISFAVTASSPVYSSGVEPQLRARVTNLDATACSLAAVSDLTVSVVSATRDGQAIVPSYGRALPIDGAAAEVAGHSASVAPGASLTFDLDASFDTLATSGGLDDGSTLQTQWPLQAPGSYQLQLVYAMPASAVAGPTSAAACAGASDPSTVAFRVQGMAGGGGAWTWIIIGIVVAVIALAVGVLLAWRALRRRRGPSGLTSTATAVVLALLVVSGAVAGGNLDTPAADAGVTWGVALTGPIYQDYDNCLMAIVGFDPGLITALNNTYVVVYPSLNDTLTKKLPNGRIGILWEWDDQAPFLGEPGVLNDPCAALYHELIHARDFADGADFDQECDDTGVSVDEVRATVAENAFRASRNPPLPVRTTYDGKPIPPTLDGCTPPKVKPGQRWASNDPTVCRGLDGPCGSHSGDPHLITFDGHHYDLQAVGEFIAVHSSAGDMDIQTRQSAFLTSRIVAIDTAIAMNVAGIRLGFYLDRGRLLVHRGGALTRFPTGTTHLPGGVKVNRVTDPVRGDSYAVVWPDASAAWISQVGPWGLSLNVQPRAARTGTITGTLGSFDGNPANDITTAGGTTLPQPPTFDQLLHTYAASWRVTDANSLFDYAAGTTTKDFTDLTFPDRPVTADSLAAADRDAAAQACALLGVVEPAALADCILDVAVTGQAAFAINALTVQAVTPSVGSTIPGTTRTLTIPAAGGKAAFTFTGAAGQRAYVQVLSTDLPDGCILNLTSPGQGALALGCLSKGRGYIDGTLLPTTGTYQVVVGPTTVAGGTLSLRVILSTDVTGRITPDGPPATASVTAAGQRANLIFSATAGEKVFVDIRSSNLPAACGSIYLAAAGGSDLQLGCTDADGTGIIDTTTLPTAGNYAVVLDPSQDTVGSATVAVTTVTDQQQAITPDGPPVTGTVSRPGARSLMTFTATAGEKVFVDIPATSLPAQCGSIDLARIGDPAVALGCTGTDGTGFIDTATLDDAGTYAVILDPPGRSTGSATVRVTVIHDQHQNITVDGPSVLATVSAPGAESFLTFSATAGQRLAVDMTGASAGLDGCGTVLLRDATGGGLRLGCITSDGTGSIAPDVVATTGTYTLVVDPSARNTGSVTIRLHT